MKPCIIKIIYSADQDTVIKIDGYIVSCSPVEINIIISDNDSDSKYRWSLADDILDAEHWCSGLVGTFGSETISFTIIPVRTDVYAAMIDDLEASNHDSAYKKAMNYVNEKRT